MNKEYKDMTADELQAILKFLNVLIRDVATFRCNQLPTKGKWRYESLVSVDGKAMDICFSVEKNIYVKNDLKDE